MNNKDKNEKDSIKDFVVEENEEHQLSLFNRMIGVFINPEETFRDIKRKANILKPGFLLMIIFAVIFFIQRDLLRTQVINQIKAVAAVNPDYEITDALVETSLRTGIIVGILSALVNPVFKGLLVHGIAMLRNGKAKLKATLSVLVYSYFIVALGQLIAGVLKAFTGNIYLSLSPAVFFSGLAPTSVQFILLSYFDIFTIGYLIVSIIGIRLVHEFSYKKAAMAVLLPSLIYILILVASSASALMA
ncbi:MAG TPA: Yip1 family protein [Clostridia bacterium]|nr:Yip1 family protein [Clostridia bacterium]